MARQDYIPASDSEFQTWFQNYKGQVAVLAATFDLTASEVAAVEADFTLYQTKLNTSNTSKAVQQAAAADKTTTRGAVVGRIRAWANRFKAHPNFSPAQGQQLGVIGPEDTTDLTTAKPTLKATAINVSAISIGFNKSVSSGVKILAKRGTETGFRFLAIDTASPYVDTRTNLATGPELRQYQAQYLVSDDPIGLVSDTLNVTVPG